MNGTGLRHYFYAIITLAIACLLAFILLSIAKPEVEGQIRLTLPPTKWDRKMLELDLRALDEAYVAKIKQLFDVWVREGLATDEMAVKGHAQAQRAYIEGRRRGELREQELQERERNERK